MRSVIILCIFAFVFGMSSLFVFLMAGTFGYLLVVGQLGEPALETLIIVPVLLIWAISGERTWRYARRLKV